ncbi:MAG: DHA2 family efflux MFS transporter permease subunit, partial [Bacteroidetes bacterium]|nr:DHA2 family efflux MFS transporter permease subunit [Bacteroidota bacterium]
DHFSWPYIFYINIPLGIIATLLTLQFVRSPKYAEKSAASDIDWLGIGLLAVFVGSLQFVLEKGHDEDWFSSSLIIFFTSTAALGAFFFIWREITYRNPVVNLRVLKNGNLRVGTILSFIMGFGLYGSTFIIPLYTQATLGWTATQAGLLMIPATLTTAFLMPFIGRLLQAGVKQQIMAAVGMFMFFVFCMWGYKILTPDTGKEAFFWMLIMRGIAMALLFIPVTTLSLSTLKGREIGEGAAFTGMMRQLGGSFGIAIITTFMAQQIMVHRADLVSKLDVNSYTVQSRVAGMQQAMIAKGSAPNTALQKAYQLMDFSVMKQASVLSYMDVFMYIGLMFLICVPFVLMVRGNKNKGVKINEALH